MEQRSENSPFQSATHSTFPLATLCSGFGCLLDCLGHQLTGCLSYAANAQCCLENFQHFAIGKVMPAQKNKLNDVPNFGWNMYEYVTAPKEQLFSVIFEDFWHFLNFYFLYFFVCQFRHFYLMLRTQRRHFVEMRSSWVAWCAKLCVSKSMCQLQFPVASYQMHFYAIS